MIPTKMRDWFSQHITPEKQLVLDKNLLPEASSLAKYLLTSEIVISDAALDATLAVVTGKASFLGADHLDVTLTGDGDDQTSSLCLVAKGVPNSWRLSALGKLPQYWGSTPDDFGLTLQDSFLKDLLIQNVSFILATHRDPNGDYQAGLNLSGELLIDSKFAKGLAVDVIRWVQGEGPLPFLGTVQLFNTQSPLIDLRAPLELTAPLSISSLKLGKPFLWLRTIMDPDMQTPFSRMDFAAKVFVGTPNPMEMTVSTELIAGSGSYVFSGYSEDKSFSLANGLTDIASLLGISSDKLSLPDGLEKLSELYIRELDLGISATDKKPQYLFAAFALPLDPSWSTPIPKVRVTGMETGWTLFFDSESSPVGYVTGTLQLGETNPVNVILTGEFPNFELIGRLEQDNTSTVSVSHIIESFLSVSDLPDINISELTVFAYPKTGDLTVSGTVTSNWSFPLGNLTSFSIDKVYWMINRSAAAGFAGAVGGQASLGSAKFDAAYSFPGNSFVIDGKIPSIHLGELIENLCNEPLSYPKSLDFTLLNSEIAISKSGDIYSFFLRTEVSDIGTLFFVIQRTPAQKWGAAVGADLSVVQKLGDVPGFDFLNQIDLTFERMALVLSSVDLPTGYTFPDLTTYNSSAPPARNKVIVPSGIGSPKQGINFYAQFAFGDKAATRHEPLLKLYDFFSIDRVLLEVAVQISDQNDSLSALLLAGFSASGQYPVSGGNGKHHLNIAAYLAIQYSQGNVSVFLRGQLTLDAPHTDNQKLIFAMELGVQENGIYAAGSMTGSWINPFDIEGLTVSDVALIVGADWEGIPSIGFAGTLTETKFNGSLACILNSEVPQQSVLAGAISNLKVGDVLDTFVHLVEPEEAAKAIIDLLNDIEINGVGSFMIPDSVSGALDHRDVQTVAQAFQTYGHVALTPTEESTLIIVGKPGQAWFITDKTNGTKHFEIYREGDHLTVSLEAQFYFTPFTTQIANLKFLQGFYVFGTLQIFGLSITSKVIISANEGVSLTERLSKIKLFGGLLSISRAPGDTRGDDSDKSASSDGPYISIASFNQPNLPSPYQTPHFFVSGALSFLGLVDLVLDIAVSSQGLHAVIKRDMFGTIFDLSIDFKPSPLTLSGGGTAGIVMNLKINLRKYGLGYYKIMKVNCTASLEFGADKDELTAHASGHLAFQVPVFDVNLGPYQVDLDLIQVDQPLTKLTTLFESAFEEMESIADDLYSVLTRDAREFVNLVKSGVLELEDTLDHVVLAIFHVNLADLTATGQCFAKARFEPHMRLLTANGSAANDTDNELDLLRKMRTDLGTSVMGRWILSIYNTLSDPLVHLYDYIPIAPEDVTFKEVLDTYHGDEVYHQLVTMLQTTGTSQPIQLTSDFVTNSEYIVSSLIDLSDQYASSGDATRVHEAALIKQGVTALLNQFPTILEYANQGLNYEQLLQKLNGMTPPSNPFNS